MIEQVHLGVAVVVVALAAALIVGVVALRVRIPYSVALLLVAIPLKIAGSPERFGPVLLFIYLPALVFEAAWNVELDALRRRWLSVAVLAVPGVAITAGAVALALSVSKQLPLLPALLLGTILAATDPVAVIAIFRRIPVPKDLAAIVEGESLFNDGVTIVLYQLVLAALATASAVPSASEIAGHALALALGGAAVGFVAALLVALVLRGISDVLLILVGTVVAAYGGYLAADAIGVSGIFAAVIAGLALRAFRHFPPIEGADESIDFFWAAVAFFATSLVFLSMGLTIEFRRIVEEPVLVVSTLLALTAARAVLAYGVLPLTGIRAEPPGWKHVVAISGMRGALSIALALGLPASLAYREQIVDAVFGVVFVTLVAQGLSIAPLLRRLRM
ncbi:MAG: cation:proton antiporter [Vulcanimicrobiaceae bacterium]